MSIMLSETDIQAFVDSVSQFFSGLSTDRVEIQTAFLADHGTGIEVSDFTGMVKVTGQYQGRIWFSAPRTLLRKVLQYMNEPSLTDENFLDAAGEITNIFAGNARRHFGEALEISPPELHSGLPSVSATLRSRPFVIVIVWERYKATLVVDVERLV